MCNYDQKTYRDPDLKYSVRPGKNDLAILLKYKENNGAKNNPYTQNHMDEFDKDEILDEIAIKCPEEVDNISSPEDWGNLRKNEMMIMPTNEEWIHRV